MSYENQNAVWKTATPLIPADIDLEDPKRAKNRAAQRKYSTSEMVRIALLCLKIRVGRKLQETKQESAARSQEESSRTGSWQHDTPPLYSSDTALYTPIEAFLSDTQPSSLVQYPQNPYDTSSQLWEGYSTYSSNSSTYNSTGPLTPVSSASPSNRVLHLSPPASFSQPEQYPQSPVFDCLKITLNQMDCAMVQWQDDFSQLLVPQYPHTKNPDPLPDLSRNAGISGEVLGGKGISQAPERRVSTSQAETSGRRVCVLHIPLVNASLTGRQRRESNGNGQNLTNGNEQADDSYEDVAKRKQRTHLRKKAEKVVDNFSQLYDLGVGLDLCARDPEFKRSLQTTKRRFNELLNAEGGVGEESDLE
jgi:hypothetical protein